MVIFGLSFLPLEMRLAELKSFSWTLALRYLNPLRTFVSIITLLSLLGVAFGVMVLIVVLSVHSGFEKKLKEILLGFAPHVRVESVYHGGIEDWGTMEQEFSNEEKVQGSYALIEGYVLLDAKGWRQPVSFRGINTESEAQTESLSEMLDLEKHPQSRADMGLDDYAVVSRQLADNLNLQVGDTLRLLASSNLDAVMEVYDVSNQERAWVVYKEQTDVLESVLTNSLSEFAGDEVIRASKFPALDQALRDLVGDLENTGPPMRSEEISLFGELYDIYENPVRTREAALGGGVVRCYEVGTKKRVLEIFEELKTLDLGAADNEAFRGIEELVLPQEVIVWGVYGDTKRAPGPHAFVPLHIAQHLKALEGTVEAVALKLDDPFTANEAANALQVKLGSEWIVRSWMSTHAQQFQLMQTEKIMMSFALSFITLLSAFSIMAVMYTVTVQKRQEIGVMKALGARPIQIVKVFLYQGLIVGVVGALLGLGLGLLAIRFRENIVGALRGIGIDAFPADFHGMTKLPAQVVPEFIAIICVVAVILCLLAALVPALFAAFRDPAKSLRNL